MVGLTVSEFCCHLVVVGESVVGFATCDLPQEVGLVSVGRPMNVDAVGFAILFLVVVVMTACRQTRVRGPHFFCMTWW